MVGSLDEFGGLLKIITKRCNPLTVLPFRCDNLSMLQKTVVFRSEGRLLARWYQTIVVHYIIHTLNDTIVDIIDEFKELYYTTTIYNISLL